MRLGAAGRAKALAEPELEDADDDPNSNAVEHVAGRPLMRARIMHASNSIAKSKTIVRSNSYSFNRRATLYLKCTVTAPL